MQEQTQLDLLLGDACKIAECIGLDNGSIGHELLALSVNPVVARLFKVLPASTKGVVSVGNREL